MAKLFTGGSLPGARNRRESSESDEIRIAYQPIEGAAGFIKKGVQQEEDAQKTEGINSKLEVAKSF